MSAPASTDPATKATPPSAGASPKAPKKVPPAGAKSPAKKAVSKKTASAAEGGTPGTTPPAKKSPAAPPTGKKLVKKSPTKTTSPSPKKSPELETATATADGGKKSPTPSPTGPKAVPAKKSPSGKTLVAAGKKSPAAAAAAAAAKKSPSAAKNTPPPGPTTNKKVPPAKSPAKAPGAKKEPSSTPPPDGEGGKKSPVPPSGAKVKTPKGKLPPGKKLPPGAKTPVKSPAGKTLGKKSPSVTPPPPEGADSPLPPPGTDGASPTPPPPPRDGDAESPLPPPTSDSPSPPPPPRDDETPRAGGGAGDDASPGPPPPEDEDGEKKDGAATDPKKKKLTPAQEAAEAERKRLAEEKQKQLEEDMEKRRLAAERAKALLDAPPPVFSVKLLIASDKETLPNWRELKMYCEVPMTKPCKEFLETLVKSKTGWESMDGYCFHKTTGDNPKTVASTGELFQTLLSPMQLGLEPGVFHFVMLKKSKPEDEPLVPVGDFFRARVERYYEFFDPDKLAKIDSVMQDFKGNEPVLMLKLQQKYGIEPTNEMILRKRAWIQRQKDILDAAEQQAARGTFNTNSVKTLSKRERENLIKVLRRDAQHRVRFDFFKKWGNLINQKRMNNLMSSFLISSGDRYKRQEALRKIKSYAILKKYRGHLHVASQIAVKSQSLLGELAEENTSLKTEIRKLMSQIDVLDNANSKRLEALYQTAHTAVSELKVMAAELRKKEMEQNDLEKSLLQLGGKYVAAVEAKEKAIHNAAEREIEWEKDEASFQARLKQLRSEEETLSKQLHAVQIAAGSGIEGDCPHCEHYFEIEGYHSSQLNLLNNLKQRVDAAENDKRKLVDTLTRLIQEQNQIGKPNGADDNDDDESSTNSEDEEEELLMKKKEEEERLLKEQRESAFRTINGKDNTNLATSVFVGSLSRGVAGISNPSRTATVGLMGNHTKEFFSSSALPSHHTNNQEQQRQIVTQRARSRFQDPTDTVRESDLFKASSLDPAVVNKLLAKKNQVPNAATSMEEFFTEDALTAVDRVRISLDRQTAPRDLERIAELIKKDPNTEALKALLLDNERYQARQAALAALSPQQKSRREVFMQQLAEQFAAEEKHQRPKPKTNHDRYSTLPATSNSTRMLSTIFDFESTKGRSGSPSGGGGGFSRNSSSLNTTLRTQSGK